MKRRLTKTSDIIFKAISEINRGGKVTILKVQEVCAKYEVSERSILKIGQWFKEPRQKARPYFVTYTKKGIERMFTGRFATAKDRDKWMKTEGKRFKERGFDLKERTSLDVEKSNNNRDTRRKAKAKGSSQA